MSETTTRHWLTGCIPLLQRAEWTIIHDPAKRAIFACRGSHAEEGGCRAYFHAAPSVCAGPIYRYGRWWWPRTPTRAFELCLQAVARPVLEDMGAQDELAQQVEIYKVMESL